MNTPLLGESQIRHRIWQELQRAVLDRHHEWRTPVLATLGVDGVPQARTVVLRHADAGQAVLHVSTDSRSPKVAELEAAPPVSLVFWSKCLNWQLRVRAQATVLRSGPEVDATWARISTSAAAGDYLSAQAPGAALEATTEARTGSASGAHHLALIKLQVLEIDWLELARSGHRRASLTRTDWTWRTP